MRKHNNLQEIYSAILRKNLKKYLLESSAVED